MHYLHEWLQHPVTTEVHGSKVDPKQPVDEVGVCSVVGTDTHRPLKHPCCTETGIICINGCQCFPVKGFGLYDRNYFADTDKQ